MNALTEAPQRAEGHLERLRRTELDAVMRWVQPGSRVLELGGGSGYQASLMAQRGLDVTSIDIPAGVRTPRQHFFDVQEYDGRTIPAEDASFDVVFSSNVLEHVPHLDHMTDEIRRVLKPGGLSVHIMPSSAWRWWTSVSYLPQFAKRILRIGRKPAAAASSAPATPGTVRAPAWWRAFTLPFEPHGEYANAISELYEFRRNKWRRLFEAHGFAIVAAEPIRLFYTGNMIAPSMTGHTRERLSRLLGPGSNVIVARKPVRSVPG
ncbi:MAG TPA: class I SAM-dependent methyltransferase [Gemmatimonadaceae bacterium]|nr:class I SAM-dependent methyltransferase [Gemmatimonadaceae bacterium]